MGGRDWRKDSPRKALYDVTRTVSDGGDPEVVLITQGRADNVSYVLHEMVCHSLENLVRPWLIPFSSMSIL